MATVGIIANPAAGKDIRRLVAQGRFVPNQEKVNTLKRILAGLDALGVERVVMMPDMSFLGRGALDNTNFALTLDFLEMPVFNEELFVACMYAAGWEFGAPALEQKPPVSDTPLGQGTATPADSSAGPLRPPEI